MPIPGLCTSCGKSNLNLMVCVFCGSRVCINCIDSRTGACKLCQGRVMRK